MNAPENPAAFPVAWHDGSAPDQGMTLRDWFAGLWISGCLAEGQKFKSPEMVAEEAFSVADAMLAERAKGGAA